MKTSGLLAFALVITSAVSFGQKASDIKVPFYGNETCPISGKPVDKSKSVTYEGQKIYVCCGKCKKMVKAKPAAFLAKAYPKDKVVDMKNAKCPIRGGKAAKGVSVVFQGRKVHFCCPGCDKAFMKEPNKKLAMLENPKLKDLGNKTCPVTGEENEADNFVIYKDQIINICCAGCAKDLQKDPKKYLRKLMKPGMGGDGHGDHDHGKGGHGSHGK